MIYRVLSFGKDVEFTKSLKDAESAYKESRGDVQLWEVQASGKARLLKQKYSK